MDEHDYHSALLFNLIDRDGHSYPHRNGKRKTPRAERVYTEDELITLIKYELVANPSSVQYVDSNKQSALHLAVSQPLVSLKIVSLLIEADPQLVKRQNDKGNLAIHILILYNCNNAVLQLLHEMYPQSLAIINSFCQNPIQVAISKGKNEVLKQLLTMDETAVLRCFVIEWNDTKLSKCSKKSKNTPLHLRLYCNAAAVEILHLLKAHPQYVMVANSNDRVPYDTAQLRYNRTDPYTRNYVLVSILRAMDTMSRGSTEHERQKFKASRYYQNLLDCNWSCRSAAMLLAIRYMNGRYFEVLKWIALFL